MSQSRISSGVERLDEVLGGGLLPGSLVIFAGEPGSGKTILAQQMCFANAALGGALYYTTLSESHTKLVEHLSNFEFFDQTMLDDQIQFIHIAELLEKGMDLKEATEEVISQVFSQRSRVVVLDSSKALHNLAPKPQLRSLFYDLASRIGHTDAVMVLVGEYTEKEMQEGPEFAVADAIIRLTNEPQGSMDHRWLRVLKLRGSSHLQGRHSFRVGQGGIEVFPRLETIVPSSGIDRNGAPRATGSRASTGIKGLDEMMGGGLPLSDSLLVVGPSGAGKTVLSLHFAAEGVRNGESVLFVSLQESADQLIHKASAFGLELRPAYESGRLEILEVAPLEVILDEVGGLIRSSLQRRPPARFVLDSLTELVVSKEKERLAAYVWALGELIATSGASMMMTDEEGAVRLAPEIDAHIALFADDVIDLSYVESPAQTSRTLQVLKMRRSDHDKRVRQFVIGSDGLELV